MEKMIDLRDLLKHEILDLYSAEEQIIAAMPAMIEKAQNPTLVKLLKDHLKVTEGQLSRLKAVQQMMGDDSEEESEGESKGFFSRLFGGSPGNGSTKCKGMEGLINEGEKMRAEDMNNEVMDAAILASAQKIEHYEICGYGTARAYARELGLGAVAELLEQTLNEEYQADDVLNDLALGRINEEAKTGEKIPKRGPGSSKSKQGKPSRGKKSTSEVIDDTRSVSKETSKSSLKTPATPASKSTSKPPFKPSGGGAAKSSSKSTPRSTSSARGGSYSSKGASKSTAGGRSAISARGDSSRGAASKYKGDSRGPSKGAGAKGANTRGSKEPYSKTTGRAEAKASKGSGSRGRSTGKSLRRR